MIALIYFINVLFEIFNVLILVQVIGSFVLAARVRLPGWAYDGLQTIHSITRPVLDPIRRLLPSIGGLDFSPLIALLLLDLVRRLVVGLLFSLQ